MIGEAGDGVGPRVTGSVEGTPSSKGQALQGVAGGDCATIGAVEVVAAVVDWW